MAGERILIVEDNAMNLRLAAFALQAAGFVVESATRAVDGIARARADPPIDLILMDVELPGTDGLAATRLLKADAATAAIPVVALTANAMHGDRERCLAAGCAGYIAKPIDVGVFPDQVRGYLPAPRNGAGAGNPERGVVS